MIRQIQRKIVQGQHDHARPEQIVSQAVKKGSRSSINNNIAQEPHRRVHGMPGNAQAASERRESGPEPGALLSFQPFIHRPVGRVIFMQGRPADQDGRNQPPHQIRTEKKPAPPPEEKASSIQRTERASPHKVARRQQKKGRARRQELRPYPPVQLRRIKGHVIRNNQDAGDHAGHIHPHHPAGGGLLQNHGNGRYRRRHSLEGAEVTKEQCRAVPATRCGGGPSQSGARRPLR